MTGPGDKKQCFVIGPIGDMGSETRKRSDQILKHILRPVTEPLGYAVTRADMLPTPGIITSQIVKRLIDSDLVIADLTDRNPNVFYELAVRHAYRRPVIQISKFGDVLPFDVATNRTIQFDITDLDSVDRCRAELASQIQAIEKGDWTVQSPISMVEDRIALQDSSDPLQRANADILAAMEQLRAEFFTLRTDLQELLGAPLSRTFVVPPSLQITSAKRAKPVPDITTEDEDIPF